MPFEDRVRVATPEGLELELLTAGLGSRFLAQLADVAIRLVALVALVVVLSAGSLAVGDISSGWAIAVLTVVGFLMFFGYDIAFEVFAGGQTPGKRANGLRVVLADGRPVDVGASVVRNFVRVVDFLPAFYLVGSLTIVTTSANQRLGDLAAGTIVVREPTGRRRQAFDELAERSAVVTVDPASVAGWDVSAVTDAEMVAIRHFLTRRLSLPPDVRARLGQDLARRVGAEVAGAPGDVHPEYLLEGIIAARS